MNGTKLYVILERALDAGLKMAQAIHTFKTFQVEHPDVESQWYVDSNNIVVLHDDDVPSLANQLEEMGFRVSRFREPDLDDQMTGVCVEPGAWKHLSTLQLAH
jgi:hypothetical protein